MGNIQTAGPNEVVVISGSITSPESKKYILGGWGWSWWGCSDTQRLSLELITLNLEAKNVPTQDTVPITVRGVAQCKVFTERVLLTIASEMFLGKSIDEIKNVIQQNLESHLKTLIGKLNYEQIHGDRSGFTDMMREVVAPSVGRMGIEVISLIITDVLCDGGHVASKNTEKPVSITDVTTDVQSGKLKQDEHLLSGDGLPDPPAYKDVIEDDAQT